MKKKIITAIIIAASVITVGVGVFLYIYNYDTIHAHEVAFADKYIRPFLESLGIKLDGGEDGGEVDGEGDGEGDGGEGGGNQGGGEAVDTRLPLEAPTLSNIGPIFSWNGVENAVSYELTLNGKQTEIINGTSFIWEDYDEGGTVTVRAMGDGIEYLPRSEESNKIILPVLGKGSAYAEFEVGDEDIYITADKNKVLLIGTSEDTTKAHIYISDRTTPLLIELDGVHCSYLGTVSKDLSPSSPLITVRVIGDSSSGFHGDYGANGSDGADGEGTGSFLLGGKEPEQGGQGGQGGDGGRLPNVIFIGSQSVGFVGGHGGQGGKGGDHAPLNTVAGKGGTGGTGGTGLLVGILRVAMRDGAEVLYYGGTAGYPGYTGAYKYPNHAANGEEGQPGTPFVGSREDYDNLRYVKTVNYTLSKVNVTIAGSYVSWEPVEGAEYYELRIGDRLITTEKTAVYWKSYRDGGLISIAPFATDAEGDIHSASPTLIDVPRYPKVTEAVEYTVGYTTAFEDIRIPASVSYCRISAVDLQPETPEEAKLCSVYIEPRSTPLHIILDEVILEYIGKSSISLDPDAGLDSLVTIETAGDGASASLGVLFDNLVLTGTKTFGVATGTEELLEIIKPEFNDLVVGKVYFVWQSGFDFDVYNPETVFTEENVGGVFTDYETVA